jgi:hypothetical protein
MKNRSSLSGLLISIVIAHFTARVEKGRPPHEMRRQAKRRAGLRTGNKGNSVFVVNTANPHSPLRHQDSLTCFVPVAQTLDVGRGAVAQPTIELRLIFELLAA